MNRAPNPRLQRTRAALPLGVPARCAGRVQGGRRVPLNRQPFGASKAGAGAWHLAALVLVIGWSTACVAVTRVTSRETEALREITLDKHWYGLTIGPCGFGTANQATYLVNLRGSGPHYTAEQIELMPDDGSGLRRPYTNLAGYVDVDDTKHTVVIQLSLGNEAFEGNGRYRYRAK